VRVSTEKGLFKGTTFYGGFVELGTQNMPAIPFLRPALKQNEKKVIEIVRIEIRKKLDQLSR